MHLSGNTVLITGGGTMEEIREGTKLSWENYLKNNPDF